MVTAPLRASPALDAAVSVTLPAPVRCVSLPTDNQDGGDPIVQGQLLATSTDTTPTRPPDAPTVKVVGVTTGVHTGASTSLG